MLLRLMLFVVVVPVVVVFVVVFGDVAGVADGGRRRERQGKAGEKEKQTLYTPNSRSPASGGNYW